jgi:hypothetical protein
VTRPALPHLKKAWLEIFVYFGWRSEGLAGDFFPSSFSTGEKQE